MEDIASAITILIERLDELGFEYSLDPTSTQEALKSYSGQMPLELEQLYLMFPVTYFELPKFGNPIFMFGATEVDGAKEGYNLEDGWNQNRFILMDEGGYPIYLEKDIQAVMFAKRVLTNKKISWQSKIIAPKLSSFIYGLGVYLKCYGKLSDSENEEHYEELFIKEFHSFAEGSQIAGYEEVWLDWLGYI